MARNIFGGKARLRAETSRDAIYCFELLSMMHIEQVQDFQLWRRLKQWAAVYATKGGKSKSETLSLVTSLPKELWFVAILLRENPGRLAEFVAAQTHREDEPLEVVSSYLKAFAISELHLDTIFRSNCIEDPDETATVTATSTVVFRPPLAIFRCCPNIRVLSLKNNGLAIIPPDIGRMGRLEKLFLTNNGLKNGSIPYTLSFCTRLEELNLDDNLLDALPSVLLRIPTLAKVHRNGNHNYYQAMFMWYHTDSSCNIQPTQGSGEPGDRNTSLQYLAAKTVIASRTNFYEADIPFRLKNYISDLVGVVELCEADGCRVVKDASEPGYKVFTFRNPYLDNTCVPFLHWACGDRCAQTIDGPARRQQMLAAKHLDEEYENFVKSSACRQRSTWSGSEDSFDTLSDEYGLGRNSCLIL